MMGNEGEDWAKKCVRMRERFPEATEIRPLYCEGEVLLAEIDGALWLSEGETLCMITSHPYEPCTYLKLRDGAVSADTAMDIAVFGVRNRNVMNGLVHGKRVGRTPDGRFFVRKRG